MLGLAVLWASFGPNLGSSNTVGSPHNPLTVVQLWDACNDQSINGSLQSCEASYSNKMAYMTGTVLDVQKNPLNGTYSSVMELEAGQPDAGATWYWKDPNFASQLSTGQTLLAECHVPGQLIEITLYECVQVGQTSTTASTN